MNRNFSPIKFILALILALAAIAGGALAQGVGPDSAQAVMGTAITYQGQLKNVSGPVNGNCDFQFSLWDSLSNTIGQIGSTLARPDVALADGRFTVQLDFGANAFTGDARWLQIAVSCPTGGSYVTLAPRQPLTPAPYALALPGLWTQQNAISPNVVGGYRGNVIGASAVGATVSGGGDASNLNTAGANYTTVGGGHGNTAGGAFATVGGGGGNAASVNNTTIGGGIQNRADGDSATVGGGINNRATGKWATVPGGESNTAAGDNSLAAGQQAKANHKGAFVWADASNADFSSTANNQFAVRASGGVVFTSTLGSMLRLTPISESPNLIGGASVNSVSPGVYGATIGGGGGVEYGPDLSGASEQNPAVPASLYIGPNTVTGIYGSVGGGWYNSAAAFSSAGGGYHNTADGNSAVIAGGNSNVASSQYAAIGGGYRNTASAMGATVPGGEDAVASHWAEMAYAAGSFSKAGDAQTSVYVLRKETTDGAHQELYLDGISARLTIPANRAMTFDILVVGRSSTNLAAGYAMRGVIENHGGATRLVGAPSVTTLGEDNPAWDATVQADDAHDALLVVVTGYPGLDIRWVATVRTAEVAW